MSEYIVKALSLSGRGNKIFKAGDIVYDYDFKAEHLPKLINDGFISPFNSDVIIPEISIENSHDKFLIFIFSYNRPEMLKQVIDDTSDNDVIIIDDGSDFKINHPNVHKFPHGGKLKFWMRWNHALSIARKSKHDKFIFMPDDFLNIDLNRINELHNLLQKSGPYVYNIINDDREWSWVKFTPVNITDDTIQIGFTDCGFFCNRETLEKLDFKIIPIRHSRRVQSSGVGRQLTLRFTAAKVPFYKPVKSLAYHGDHPSMMHPSERKRNPIISK